MSLLTAEEKRRWVERKRYFLEKDYSLLSDNELKTKYKYLKKKLYRDNKWQIEEFKPYCKPLKRSEEEVLPYLMNFEIEYSSRIASLKSFKSFLKTLIACYKQDSLAILQKHKNLERKWKSFKFELKDEVHIGDFLIAVKQLKVLLKCNNEEIIAFIQNNIDTGYSKQTLLKHYYSYNSEK